MQDIHHWLEANGLAKYSQAFYDNDIGVDVVAELTNEDLKELGVSLGDRKRFKTIIDSAGSTKKDTTVAAEHPINVSGEAERRQLTVMFCDLVDSTGLAAKLDPEDLSEIVRGFQDACAGIISRYDGYIARYMGDGMLVYFGYPRAHEDDAERALHTGLEIIERIQQLLPRPNLSLSTRIGVATGLVLVGETIGVASSKEQVVMGETPNLAARLQGIAKPDQMLIADDTRRLGGDLFEYTALGEQSLKGFDQPVLAYRVTTERDSESRFEARSARSLLPLIGRDHEINLIKERWRLANNNEGQLVLLIGEAGIGKSRIARALTDAVAGEDHFRMSLQCSPYHQDSILYPVIQHINHTARLKTCIDDTERLCNLDEMLASAGEISNETAALFAGLIGLDGQSRYGKLDLTPQQQRVRTLQALVSQMIGLSKQKPVLFVFEDAHWIDPTTQEFLDNLLDMVACERIMILVTARPTYNHGFGGHPIVTRLTLNRLGRDQVGAIIDRLTLGKRLPDELLDEIAAKTDGVPLFIEELTKSVLESGLVHETENGYSLYKPLEKLSIPITLHDSLMARLDRIPAVKEVAQIAACIGREFDYSLLRNIAPLADTELLSALNKLIEAELVYRRGLGDEAAYQFKHALVRDAAYESLLKSKRVQIHGRLVDALEQSDSVAPELIAHHATHAGLNEKAIDYWQQAGELAIARPAYAEALSHFGNAIRLAREMGDGKNWWLRELELQLVSGQAHIATSGYSAAPTAAAFERAMELSDALGDTPLRVPAMFGDWVVSYIRGEETSELAKRFLDVAIESSDSGHRIVGMRMVALGHWHRGEFDIAARYVNQALDLYDADLHRDLCWSFAHDPRSAMLNYKAWAFWFNGYADKAWQTVMESLSWARQLGHVNTIGIARCWGPLLVSVFRRDTATVIEEATSLIDYSEEMAMTLWRSWAQVFLGWARVIDSGKPDGLALITEGLAEASNLGAVRLLPFNYSLAAEAYARVGETDRALEYTEAALAETQTHEDIAWLSFVHIVRAQIFRQVGNQQQEVYDEYEAALSVARRQKAKSMELRAATGLAELWADEGEPERARDLLSPLYQEFTEGFATSDLQQAKTLLETLDN